jgi:hypothetical protein
MHPVVGFGRDVAAQHAAPLHVGAEGPVQADGAPSKPIGFSMPQTKHMRELGCLFMMSSPCAVYIIASRVDSGKLRWPEARLVVACNSVSDTVGHRRIFARQAADTVILTHQHSLYLGLIYIFLT